MPIGGRWDIVNCWRCPSVMPGIPWTPRNSFCALPLLGETPLVNSLQGKYYRERVETTELQMGLDGFEPPISRVRA